MLLNQYNLYSMNVGVTSVDEVDDCVQTLQRMTNYNDVVQYLNNKFGDIGESKLLEYKDLDKQIEIKFKPDAVEFFAAKKWTQYYGKGWRK